MKFKNKIKIIIEILFVISLIINFLCIRSTYGKYLELVDTDYEVEIRKWFVVVGEKDIQDEATVMKDIIEPVIVENEHVKSNILVPGGEGYFDIDLDYTKVDVPFTYTFNTDQLNTNKLTDFEYIGYEISLGKDTDDDGKGVELKINSMTDEITYTGEETYTTRETTDAATGTKKLELIKSTVDAETGVTRNEVRTVTLMQVAETGEKKTTITDKTVNADTGAEIVAEELVFEVVQVLDENTNKTTYTVTQALDPKELTDEQRHQNFRPYFKWNDDADNLMDNLADTQFRGLNNTDTNVKNTVLKYQATLSFKQYVQ